MEGISADKAKELLNSGIAQAEELMKNPGGVMELLAQIEAKLKEVPVLGETLGDIPTLISMVKSYFTDGYKVSPKVVASIIGAFIYVARKKDLIPDNIAVVGIVDDIAVIGLVIKLCGNEIDEFRVWKKDEEPAAEEKAAEEPAAEEKAAEGEAAEEAAEAEI